MSKPFEKLTEAQVKEICNGCGGKGSWITPPHAIFFDEECDRHDYKYWQGCTEDDRLDADVALREDMRKACSSLRWYKQLRYRPWCWAYYYGVRWGGEDYFYYDDERRTL